MKGQGLHHAQAHLKTTRLVVGLVHASNLKVRKFQSRLIESSGGWEKIVPVSGSFFFNCMACLAYLVTPTKKLITEQILNL